MINELQYDTTLYTTPPGFQLIGVYPGVSVFVYAYAVTGRR